MTARLDRVLVGDKADVIRREVIRLLASDGQDGEEVGQDDDIIIASDDENCREEDAGEGGSKGPMYVSKPWLQGRWESGESKKIRHI